MIIEETIEIDAPLPVVWEVFSCFETWGDWNRVCLKCRFVEESEMAPGARLSFIIRLFGLPIRITPRITKCAPGEEICWRGERFGIRAEHLFLFRRKGEGVVLTSIEKFQGFMVFFSIAALVPFRLHALTKDLLASIRNEAERRHRSSLA